MIREGEDKGVVGLLTAGYVRSQYNFATHIYTDGSNNPVTGHVSAAFSIPDIQFTQKKRQTNNLSVFTSKLMACNLEEHKPLAHSTSVLQTMDGGPASIR